MRLLLIDRDVLLQANFTYCPGLALLVIGTVTYSMVIPGE